MNTANMHWELLAPEYILAGWAAAIILLDLFWGRLGKDQLGYVDAVGAFIAAGGSLCSRGGPGSGGSGSPNAKRLPRGRFPINTANMNWELLAPEYILAGWAAAIIL